MEEQGQREQEEHNEPLEIEEEMLQPVEEHQDKEKEAVIPPSNISELEPGDNKESLERKLSTFETVMGFGGVVVLNPAGEPMAMINPKKDVPALELAVLVNNIFLQAQQSSNELGVGFCDMLHLKIGEVHVLAKCIADEMAPSQKNNAFCHLILILDSEAGIGLAKMKMRAIMNDLVATIPS